MATAERIIQTSIWKLPAQDLRAAEAEGRRLLREHPLSTDALSLVARAHFDRGDDAEALRLLQQTIAINPRYFPGYDSLVRVLEQMGQHQRASAMYDEWSSQMSQSADGMDVDSDNPFDSAVDNSSPEYVANYYALRAYEYDATCGYMDPRNAEALQTVQTRYQELLRDRDVIEIACGTGYWTAVIAATARSVLATDRNKEQISIVQEKFAATPNVRCQVADAYTLDTTEQQFDAAFSHFWWSHIPKSMIRQFLSALHAKLKPGALVIFSDSLPYLRKRRLDTEGNVLEQRFLRNGDMYEVIKNFPLEAELRGYLQDFATDVTYTRDLPHRLWTVAYRAK